MTLAQVRRFAMSLPEATEEPHFDYTSFRVRKKIFATAPPDGKHLHVFVGDQERDLAITMEPGFLEPLVWGGKVRGVRVVLATAKPKVVCELMMEAWSRKAPKTLLAKSRTSGEPGAG